MELAMQNSVMSPQNARTLAMGLGWFSIGLGFIELFAPRQLTKSLGMEGNEKLVRFYGMREIASGIGVLRTGSAPWLWGRVAGDALDIATLVPHVNDDNPKKTNARIALAAVAAVTSLDVACAIALRSQPTYLPAPDYSRRSGFPRGIAAARGAAREFVAPNDMRTPEAMRPWT
jgi:hypothetical protein